jgi:hypothetical protein
VGDGVGDCVGWGVGVVKGTHPLELKSNGPEKLAHFNTPCEYFGVQQ